ncbi:MAG: hypothetical protein EXS52_01900 [Candidatus Staskawiczbacteria bacterium]|nr:hypothetical protein [Candidatus Staskawiczbacteria bacterium]
MNANLPDLILQNHNGFRVVRGDLFPGGIKSKCLASLLEEVNEKEVVYAAHAYGHSGLALGLAGIYNHKKVTLFFPGPRVSTYIFDQTASLNNVDCVVVDQFSHQSQIVEMAQHYAREHNAHFMPVGFDYPPFTDRLVSLARSLDVNPKEAWVSGGSGTTSRCLAKAWPNAKICTVNLGMMPNVDMGTPHVFHVPEKPEMEAELPPPYPSAKYYDAKIWRFIQQHATKGALIWNIA